MSQQQAVAQQTAAITQPGWYPDPVTGAGERYWDGIEWSRDFTRPGPGQHAPQPQPQLVQYPAASSQQSGLTKGLIPMAIAVGLFTWRISYTASYISGEGDRTTTNTEALNMGVLFGSLFGFFLTGLLFTWGLNRYRSASASPTGEPSDVSFGDSAPLAVGIAVAGAAISYVLGTQ